jgi:hypothetical protein
MVRKNYAPATGEELQALLPYQFAHPNVGFAFYRGWLPLVAAVCVDIDKLLGPHRAHFHWRQIKEKFGTLRMYYCFDGQSVGRLDGHAPQGIQSLRLPPADGSGMQQAICRLLDAAEQESACCCMVCGQPAQTQSYDRYHLTLCSSHHPDKIRRPGDLRWEAVWALAEPNRPLGET